MKNDDQFGATRTDVKYKSPLAGFSGWMPYINKMENFDFGSPAELYLIRGHRRKGLHYLRFETAAEAVRFVVEHDADASPGPVILEVDGERFDDRAVDALYASEAYPFARKSVAV